MKKFFFPAWRVLKAAIHELAIRDPFRMAGATAFFTTFALPAMLMIIVRTLGLFMDRQTVGRGLADQLTKVLGPDSMDSVFKAIRSFRALQHNYLITTGLFIFLLFVATTLFKIIKSSVDEIWNIRIAPEGKLRAALKSRAISVAVMLLGGVLFLAAQLIDAGQQVFGRYLVDNLPDTTFYLGRALHMAAVILISTVWFYVLFTFLPDGRPSKKIVLGGACMTALLFSAGKLMLRVLLSPGRVNSFYGASGALVLVLLFMFYSSLILYFGAAVIKAWSDAAGKPVEPKPHAVVYRTEAVE